MAHLAKYLGLQCSQDDVYKDTTGDIAKTCHLRNGKECGFVGSVGGWRREEAGGAQSSQVRNFLRHGMDEYF
jgi:hypothetical protein